MRLSIVQLTIEIAPTKKKEIQSIVEAWSYINEQLLLKDYESIKLKNIKPLAGLISKKRLAKFGEFYAVYRPGDLNGKSRNAIRFRKHM